MNNLPTTVSEDEMFVLNKLREYRDSEYVDFKVEKRKGGYSRVVVETSHLNPSKRM